VKTVRLRSSAQARRTSGSAKVLRIDWEAGGHPQLDQRGDGPSGGLGGKVDHQVEVCGHPGVAVEHDGYTAHDDEPHVGGVERRQHRLEQRHAHNGRRPGLNLIGALPTEAVRRVVGPLSYTGLSYRACYRHPDGTAGQAVGFPPT